MKKNFKKGEWKVGRQGTVVSDTIPENHSNLGHTDVEYYGGYLIAESIANQADVKLVAAAPDMYDALSRLIEEVGKLIDFTSEQRIIDWEDDWIDGVKSMKDAQTNAINALRKATE